MPGLTNEQVAGHGFLRSALLVSAAVLLAGLLLAPFAARQTDMNGMLGLASAAAICLFAAWCAEGVGCALSRAGSHLAAMLLSMALRFVPPLAVCFVLAASGADGRQHFAFVCYLLVFYLATLAVETWLAVKRVDVTSPKSKSI
jgi:hypothetical protein